MLSITMSNFARSNLLERLLWCCTWYHVCSNKWRLQGRLGGRLR